MKMSRASLVVVCGLLAVTVGRDPHSDVGGRNRGAGSEVMCPPDWLSGRFMCYKVVPLKVNWVNALMHCAAMRAHLVDINSRGEQMELEKLLRAKHTGLKTERLWIGGSDLSSNGQWQWVTARQNMSYTHWYRRTPPPAGRGAGLCPDGRGHLSVGGQRLHSSLSLYL
ncbi:C-type lectin Cal-like [Haliotis rubra]|uniref:C-type lectin Cal-like n=1 Tax=Haliotis rubra TaxID=36100 RepID=UPI001EE5891A|nr:C-type lectin Cal-like [Haliotis rubra]